MEHNYYTEKKNAQRIEQENARIEAQNTEPINTDFAKNPFSSVKESSQKVLQARDENEGKFGVKLRPEQYQAIIDYSNDGETIEEMERRRYTMAQALFYSNELGVSPEEAMDNLDNYNRIVLGEYYNVDDYKTNWEAVQDCFNAGMNSLKIGDLGFEYYLNGRRPGADEYYKKQTDLLEQKNITYADDNPNRPWYVDWLKAGAEMLPFTGKTLLLNAIPIIGPGLSTGYSMSQMTGTEYVQMRKDGADHETAFGVATASGVLQGLVETGLGDAANYALNKTGLARFTGNFKQAVAKKVTQKVFTNTHYNRTLAKLGKAVVRAVENPFEEAAEEVMQNAISTLGKLVLKAIDEEYKPEDLKGWNFLEDSWEQGKSAFMGSFVFGLAMKPGQHVFSTMEAHKVVKAAESTESFTDFKNKVKDSVVFKGYNEGNERTTAMRQAFDFYQNRRDEAYYNINRLNDINEINQPAEGFEEDQYDETGELIPNSEYRKDTGDLYTEDKVISSEDGITKGYYKVGNPTKGGKNSYGSINYTLDENTNTVTIDKFIMPKSRENIRGEFFRQFAKDYAGYNIEYDAVGEDAVKIRENLVNSNPSGVNNGLNYYTNETTKQDIKTRQNIASQIRKAMPRLNGTQVATHVALLEAMYKSLKEENGYRTFQDFINGTFAEEMFGDEATLNQAASESNKKVRGGVSFRDTSNGIRAVIYAGEHADFSTFAHEVSHVFRKQMQGELLKKAEEAFGVKEGKWTEAQEEAFAEGFEQFLHTGKCENKAIKPLFQKIAEFMARVYGILKGHIQFAPGVEEVYNQLLKGGDGSELALAMKAVRANDRLIKQQESEYTSYLEKEKAKVKEQEQFDASETTVNEDTEEVKEEEPVAKDFEQEVKEADLIGDDNVIDPKKVTALVQKIKQNSDTESLATVEKQKVSIESTLSNLENKKQIAEKLTDPSSSLQDKIQTTMEAAEDEREEVIDLFQLMGTDTIRYIADKEMLKTILLNLKTAMDVDRKKMLGYTEEQKQRYIKSQTNWQKVNGKWLYEYSDDGMLIDLKNFKQALLQLRKEDLETFNKNNNLTVENFVIDKGLFDMFPEIKELRVKFINTQASRFGSMFDSNSKTIAINLSHKDVKASFAAGIQRYLQSLTNDIDYRLIAELDSAYREAIIKAGIGKLTGTQPFIDRMKCNNASVEFLQNELNERAMQVASRVHNTENETYHTLLDTENGISKSQSKVFFQSDINSPQFKKWFKDSKVVDEDGKPKVVYHGTYNGKFDIFDKNKASIESDMGAGFYFTSSYADVEQNYEGGGPDFDNKVKRLAEQIQSENEELDYEEAKRQAYVQLYVDKDLYEVYLSMQNPVYIGDKETDIIAELWEDLDVNEENYENEEDYYKAIYAAQDDLLAEIKDAITYTDWYGAEEAAEKVIQFLTENDSGTLQDLKDYLNDGSIEVDTGNGDWGNNEIARIVAEAMGYDGIIDSTVSKKFRNMSLEEDTTHYIVFKPNQIKSATDNNGQFDNENPSILFQGERGKTLFGIHNISEDAIKHVFKIGGLANPSMAVVDINKSNFTNFGEISLIPYNFMLTKKEGRNAGTYGADIYSPRYPSITTEVTSKGKKQIEELFNAIEDEDIGYHFARKLIDRLESSSFNRRFLSDTTLPIAYLLEKGKKDFIAYDNKLNKYPQEIIDKLKNVTDYRDASIREYVSNLVIKEKVAGWNKHIADAEAELEDAKKRNAEEEIKKLEKKLTVLEKMKKETIEKNTDPETGAVYFAYGQSYIDDIQRAIRENGKVNEAQTQINAREIVDNNQEFNKWAEEKLESIEMDEKIFDGFTPGGNRKYLKHTLNNVSKYMKRQGLRGGENFGYGMGTSRAKVTPKFTTLEQIRKAKDRIVSKEDFEAVRDQLESEYDWTVKKLAGDNDYDTGAARLDEAIETGSLNTEYLNKEYDLDITEEEGSRIRELVDAMKKMPTEYFETKFERPVYINEFAAAVVPKNTSQEVKDKLKKEGLYVREYNNDETRYEQTKQAILEASEKRNILFQQEYNPRDTVPNVRGGWTEKKIIKYLKDNHSHKGAFYAAKFISEFKTVEELKDHMFYHGTVHGYGGLKPSITMSDREVEQIGGGGYGQKYWSISVTRDKKVAATFSGANDHVSVYPIVLAKNAKVIEMPELKDSADLEDHIVDLWNKGVDAVWIGNGKNGSGEQELSVLNPNAIVNIDRSSFYKVYKLGSEENPIKIKSDESIAKMLEFAKEYMNTPHSEYDFGKPRFTESYPISPNVFEYDEKGKIKIGEDGYGIYNPNYEEERKIYEEELKSYNEKKEAWKKEVKAWEQTEGYKDYNDYQNKLKSTIFFQSTYHGSAANFDKFKTDEYGFSGEGSMSFGYGTYVSESEEIARDYAERQWDSKYGGVESQLKVFKHQLKESKKDKKNISLESFTEQLQRELNDKKAYMPIFEERYKAGEFTDNDKRSAENSLWKAEENLKNAEELYKEKVKEIDSKIEYYSNLVNKYEEKVRIIKEEDPKRNLYTVNIPDNDYIKWDEYISEELVNTVKEAVYTKLTTEPNEDGEFTYKGNENELKRELNDAFNNELTGEQLYNNVAVYIGGEKNASKLLNRLGIPGIDYPAYSNFGNAQGKEARNYVIFNDDDAKIVEHILFQTMKELYDDARSCESWQDFMEFYESFGKPEPSLVPEDADAQWYQTTWEMANNLVPESQENEEIVKAQLHNDMESDDPALAKDALFMTKLERPGELESFLERIHDIMQMDLEMFADAQDEADAQERDQLMDMQNYIRTSLTHGSWLSNAGRISKGSPLTNKARKTLLSLIRNATRDYRDIYSTIMNDTEYAVEERDKVVNKLNQYRIADPDVDYSRQSPEQRARIANQMQNEQIAQKIKDGTLLMDGELEQYINYLDGKIKEAERETRKKEKELQELHMDIQGDYQKLSDWETRRLLELHDEMLIARTKLTNHSNATARRLNRGLAITGKYEQNAQNLKANYDSVYKKFDDLRKSIEISEEVKNALKERERVAELKDNIKGKQDEKKLVEKAKKMRINLVKRTMRRVPFDRINYDQARTLIAIQRTLEPNLLGGVNKWIGQDQAYLRGVISQWITDADARAKITKELTDKGTPGAIQLLEKLNQTETIEDFNNWTAAERKQAHRILPKENWIKELDLVKLAKEREQSIQLDIQEITETKETTDENGKKTWLTRTSVILTPELESEIRAALGEKLFNQVMAVPFNEWTTEEMEDLAKRVDEIYIEGRNLLAAKRQAKKELADEIRGKIEQAVKDTGIVIEADDDDETKRKKQEQINKILGKNKTLAGTLENNDKGFFKSIKRIINGYGDANVLRVARVLDNWKEGINVQELYRKEDYCYNAKARSIQARNENIERIMKANGITAEELMETVTVAGHEFTVDELLYMKAANMDYEEDTTKNLDPSDYYRLEINDDYAPTSRNAVMFGNMLSSQEDLEFKEECRNKDLAMQKRIEADDLTAEERNAKILNMLITKPGTRDFVNRCKTMFEKVLYAADQLDPKYNALLDAINNDYSDQYDRMNKVSIEEFNSPINRVKQYVPLIRLESNGDTNENRVREDLLGAFGVGKQWVDKGMTKSRINIGPLNQKPVETGLYKTWTDSVERTEHFINYSPYVRELNAVYKSRDAQFLRGYIENRYGKDMIKYIDDYINEVANPNASGTMSELDKIIRTLRGKTAPAYLAWKASGVIKQAATSPWPFMAYVSPAKYLAASFDIMKSHGKIYDDIKSMSAFMNERVFDPMVDLVDELAEKKTNPFNHAMNQFGKRGMEGLEWIDWVCVAPGWLACFRDKYAEINGTRNAMYEVNKAKLTEENNKLDIDNPDRLTMEQINKKADKITEDEVIRQSVEYADDCTRACQPSSRAVDLAPLFKAKGPNSEVGKALLQFQTSLNVIWQNIRYDIPYAVKNKQYGRMVQTILGYVFAGILMNLIVNHPDDEEDEADKLRKYIWYSTTQFTDAIPIIGQMTTNLSKQLITGKKGYSSGNDIMPMLTKFYNSATSIRSGNWDKAARSFLEGVGMSQGLPVSGTKEALWAVGIGDGDGKLKLRPDAFIGHRAKD